MWVSLRTKKCWHLPIPRASWFSGRKKSGNDKRNKKEARPVFTLTFQHGRGELRASFLNKDWNIPEPFSTIPEVMLWIKFRKNQANTLWAEPPSNFFLYSWCCMTFWNSFYRLARISDGKNTSSQSHHIFTEVHNREKLRESHRRTPCDIEPVRIWDSDSPLGQETFLHVINIPIWKNLVFIEVRILVWQYHRFDLTSLWIELVEHNFPAILFGIVFNTNSRNLYSYFWLVFQTLLHAVSSWTVRSASSVNENHFCRVVV